MKKIFNAALVLAGAFLFAFFPQNARAQFTTVTATITDPNGVPYAGAVMNAVLVPGASGGYTLNGAPYSGRIGPVTLDSTGKFTVNFGDVTLITPGSPQWSITIDSAAATIGVPFGIGPQTFTFTSSGTTISGGSVVNLSTSLNALAPNLTNTSIGTTITGGGRGSFSAAPLLGSAPAMFVLDCTLCSGSDTIGWIMRDSAAFATTNPIAEVVMKSTGQVEEILSNRSGPGYVNLQVGVAGFGELTSYNGLTIDTANNADISLRPGAGSGGANTGNVHLGGTSGGGVFLKNLAAEGAGASASGSGGACASLTLPVAVGLIYAAVCNTAATGATTITLTPPAGTPTPTNAFWCFGDDVGGVGGGGGQGTRGVQSGYSNTQCVVIFPTGVQQNDIIILKWGWF